ncbi:hypothetical protein ACFL0L_01260 [Patescibacteria group bacterium]
MPREQSKPEKKRRPSEDIQRYTPGVERKKMLLWMYVAIFFIIVIILWVGINPLSRTSSDGGGLSSIKEGFEEFYSTIKDFAGFTSTDSSEQEEKYYDEEYLKQVEKEVFPQFE